MLKKIMNKFKNKNPEMLKKIEKYNLKVIDNTDYLNKRNEIYNLNKEIEDKISILNKELEKNKKILEDLKDISMEIGIKIVKDFNYKDLKINDEVLFISYAGGYGIFKGIYERNDGYASLKNIEMVFHPKNVSCCSHRVDFKDIIRIIN